MAEGLLGSPAGLCEVFSRHSRSATLQAVGLRSSAPEDDPQTGFPWRPGLTGTIAGTALADGLTRSLIPGIIELDANLMRSIPRWISPTTFARSAISSATRSNCSIAFGRPDIPLVLTVNGRAELVVQDAAAYQALLDRVEAIEGIQRGLADVKAGRTRPARKVFARLRRTHGIPR